MTSVREDAKIDGSRDAMLRLLDDESPYVRQAVLEELAEWGDDGISFLRSIEDRGGSEADTASELLRELGWEDGAMVFRRFIRDFSYELESGFLLLDKVIRPGSSPAATCLRLDELANRCEELSLLPSSPSERCRLVSRVLFHEEALRGARLDFHNPMNSSLSFVLEEKRGLPMTLCVIFLLVARRIGLELEPVGLPGRFMVGCFQGEGPFFVDAFEGGRMRTSGEVISFLRKRDLDDSARWLLPTTVGDLLRRACRNLVSHHLRSGNEESAHLFSTFGNEFEEAYRRASGN